MATPAIVPVPRSLPTDLMSCVVASEDAVGLTLDADRVPAAEEGIVTGISELTADVVAACETGEAVGIGAKEDGMIEDDMVADMADIADMTKPGFAFALS